LAADCLVVAVAAKIKCDKLECNAETAACCDSVAQISAASIALFWPAFVAQVTMHIQFDEAGQPRPHAAHPSVAAGFQCVSSVRVDFQSDATYVFELAHNGQGLVAAALSNTRIKLFNFR
jgi:hypothetical protein